MPSRRKNFTDRQRAEIFVLDHALCSFTGKSLWLLDYGAAPSSVVQVDHIKPAAKGGTADIANGACASWLYNWARRSQEIPIYLFQRGKPTADFFTYHGIIPDDIAEHLHRFAALHWSDWYFKSAVSCVLTAANLQNQWRVNGEQFSRNREYWATRAMLYLEKWSTGTPETTPFHSRNLVPKSPWKDHKALLELTSVSSLAEVKKIIARLVPYVRESWNAMLCMAHLKNTADAHAFTKEVARNSYIVPRVKEAIRHNVRLLYAR